ncbi:MAG: septal ring lytic transglycosylase RlpA family protein [Alphaproteobacteria bacterium]|nr:septal ring lytic transglycosylase RlpA family protein [Alphaproteobacteria bacterium]
MKRFSFLFLLVFILSGCARIELASHFGKKLAGTTEKSVGLYKVGSPYNVKGKKYYPSVDCDYDEKGIASWYGPNFHGKQTANGETFDQNELTAAHKTLPLPSIVRVTNLENGKSLIVRVNDRGPFSRGRIIDMSKRSAELLGFKQQGVAKVRVQVLEKESRMVAQMAKNYQDTRGVEVPMNRPGYQQKTYVAQGTDDLPKAQKAASVQRADLTPKTIANVPGHIRDGNFYPDPMLTEYPVRAQQIYVQMGSFTSRDNAMKFSSALESYGRAQVHTADIDGVSYYRVRLPNRTVAEADALLERVVADGHENALIVVADCIDRGC